MNAEDFVLNNAIVMQIFKTLKRKKKWRMSSVRNERFTKIICVVSHKTNSQTVWQYKLLTITVTYATLTVLFVVYFKVYI